MFENLTVYEDRYQELNKMMMDPEVQSDSKLLQKTAIEHLSLIHISEPTRREWLSRMPSSA